MLALLQTSFSTDILAQSSTVVLTKLINTENRFFLNHKSPVDWETATFGGGAVFEHWVALELLKRWVSELEPMFAKNINGEIVGVVARGTTDVLIYARALPGYYQKAAEPRRFRFKRPEQPQ